MVDQYAVFAHEEHDPVQSCIRTLLPRSEMPTSLPPSTKRRDKLIGITNQDESDECATLNAGVTGAAEAGHPDAAS
jgi:hypothetical protein